MTQTSLVFLECTLADTSFFSSSAHGQKYVLLMAEQTMSNQEMKRKKKNPLTVEAQLWANDLVTLALDLQIKNQTFCFFLDT